MSGERVVFDGEWHVYRIRKSDGTLAGLEYGEYPLGWDTRAEAEEQVELRAERAKHLRNVHEARRRGL